MSESVTTTTVDTAPKVWPACLSCHSAGYLVGRWTQCTDAAEVTIESLHKGSGRRVTDCEEMYCFDHEYLPVRGELGLIEAAEWGQLYEKVGPEQWPALCAWVESGSHTTEGDSDIPVRSPDAHHTGHLSTMSQGFGYLLAGLGPIGIGAVHAATGEWVVPLAVLGVLPVVQLVAGVLASRTRFVAVPREWAW